MRIVLVFCLIDLGVFCLVFCSFVFPFLSFYKEGMPDIQLMSDEHHNSP